MKVSIKKVSTKTTNTPRARSWTSLIVTNRILEDEKKIKLNHHVTNLRKFSRVFVCISIIEIMIRFLYISCIREKMEGKVSRAFMHKQTLSEEQRCGDTKLGLQTFKFLNIKCMKQVSSPSKV